MFLQSCFGMAQLSILVHPDKNTGDADRAQQAFEGSKTNIVKY